jgi:hypothetical protein
MSDPRAIVLLSGGLDSATALAIARNEGFKCRTLAVGYGQRHSAELTRREGFPLNSVRLTSPDECGSADMTMHDRPCFAVPSRPTSTYQCHVQHAIPVTFAGAGWASRRRKRNFRWRQCRRLFLSGLRQIHFSIESLARLASGERGGAERFDPRSAADCRRPGSSRKASGWAWTVVRGVVLSGGS